jgi:hypothetical protein
MTKGLTPEGFAEPAQKLHYTLRIASAMCLIGHGAFGIITKAVWCNYFAVFGIGHDMAYHLMPVVGCVDILLGLSLLVYPTRIVLSWLVLWAVRRAFWRIHRACRQLWSTARPAAAVRAFSRLVVPDRCPSSA